MIERTRLPFVFVLLLTGFHLFQAHLPSRYPFETFGLPAIFATSALTRDTTHLPRVRFITNGPALSPPVEAKLRKGIHFLYKFYITQLGYAFPQEMPIVIRIFGDHNAYMAYTAQVTTSPVNTHVGLYVYDTREIVVWRGANNALFKKIVFHETSHLLLRSRKGFCPRWLSEGLSEYFEELDLSGNVTVVRPQLNRDKRMKKRLLAGRLPALEAFLAQTDQQWSRADNNSAMPRTLAWSLVYFLMESEGGQQVIKELLSYYQNRRMHPGQSVSLVNTLTGTGSFVSLRPGMAVKLEKEWHRWVAQEREEQQIMLGPLWNTT